MILPGIGMGLVITVLLTPPAVQTVQVLAPATAVLPIVDKEFLAAPSVALLCDAELQSTNKDGVHSAV